MDRKKYFKIATIVTLISILIIFQTTIYADSDDGRRYWSMSYGYHVNNPETGITIINSNNPKLEESVIDVEIITSGAVYEKYSSYFDGDIMIYNIQLSNQGKSVDILPGDDIITLIFPDHMFTVYPTAEIYHINSDGTLTDLDSARVFIQDANQAIITSLGYFIVTKATLNDSSVLIVPTPSPTPDPTPTPIPRPTPISFELGDVNMDKQINANDALMILKHSAKLEELTPYKTTLSDVNDDRKIDSKDALSILKYAAGIIDNF